MQSVADRNFGKRRVTEYGGGGGGADDDYDNDDDHNDDDIKSKFCQQKPFESPAAVFQSTPPLLAGCHFRDFCLETVRSGR